MLLISTGEELPAHAAYLSAYSTVFAGILEAHYTSSIHDKRTARIPLPDCSLQEAQIFLCYLYRMRSDAQLSSQSARAIVKVAHKFDVRVALEQCDAFLAQQAALNIRSNSLWVRQTCSIHRYLLTCPAAWEPTTYIQCHHHRSTFNRLLLKAWHHCAISNGFHAHDFSLIVHECFSETPQEVVHSSSANLQGCGASERCS